MDNNKNKKLILMVDDNQVNLEILSEMLEDDYLLETAKSGEEAIQKLEAIIPDLILLDIMMPGIDGFETCKRIKKSMILSDIPIIFLSAKQSTKDKVTAFKVGGVDYITKPFETEEIIARIETHLKLRDALKKIDSLNKNLEKKLIQRTKALVKSEKDAAFSLLIQGIVHNLRGPLTGVSGNAELAQMTIEHIKEEYISSNPSISRVKKYLANVVESADRLQDMISSLLVKGRNDKSENFIQIDLNELIKTEVEFLKANESFKHKIDKEFNYSAEKLLLTAIPSEIIQVFQNIVLNAVDILWKSKNPKVYIETGRDSEHIWFAVGDNGPGVEKTTIDKIFDPFFTTKKPVDEVKNGEPSGTGIGLHTCKEIIKAYDGNIIVESEIGVGTKFIVKFLAE